MNKIVETIYLEKEPSPNLALVIGGIIILGVYFLIVNDIIISIISGIISFALFKTIFKGLENKIESKRSEKEFYDSFSEAEKDAINLFIEKGSCWLSPEEICESKWRALRSLSRRGLMESLNEDPSEPEKTTSIILIDSVYTKFLKTTQKTV